MDGMEQTDPNREHEVLIVGGGPAGLSAALTFGRALVDTVVVSAEQPRSAAAAHSHGFLSRDRIPPLELVAAAKGDLERYETVAYLRDTVDEIVESGDGFAVATVAGRELRARRLVFATGRSEQLGELGVPGIEDVYGVSVFPCPFCDGWERRGEPLALFAGAGTPVKFARVLTRWTEDLIVFTNGSDAFGAEQRELLARGGLTVEPRTIAALEHDGGRLRAVLLGDGGRIERSGGFVATGEVERASELPSGLGPDRTYPVGDLASGFAGIAEGAADGYRVAKQIVHEIVAERWEQT